MLPFHEYITKHANRELLVEKLYEDTLEDIIFCHNRDDKEIKSICEYSVDEILGMCKSSTLPVKNEDGYLSTFMNGTLNEVCWFANNDKYDMMFHDWSYWMDCPVSDDVDPEEFCISAILTMTFFGFNDLAHKKRVAEINEELKKVDIDNEENYISADEVQERLKELIENTEEKDEQQ